MFSDVLIIINRVILKEDSQVRVQWWLNYSGLQERYKLRCKKKHYFCSRNLRTCEV